MKGKKRISASKITLDARKNDLFEKYYRGQGIVPEEEWDKFISHLRLDLPITFRVTGFRHQNKELARLINCKYRDELSSVKRDADDDIDHVEFDNLPWYPDGLAWQLTTDRNSLRKNPHLKALHQFLVSETESGNVSRQEAVSMLPPLVMGIRAHHNVLDMCAAPGSKSAQLVELMHSDAEKQARTSSDPLGGLEPTGCVIANDVDQKRSFMLTHQVKRLQSPCVMITQEDGTNFPRLYVPVPNSESNPGPATRQLFFDRILTDAPCSGDGTLRKNPDQWLRWHPNLGINEHVLQTRLLRRGLEMLRDPDLDSATGDCSRLVYSTCSFNPMENEAVVASLLQACQGSVKLVEPDCVLTTSRQDGKFFARPGLSTWRVMSRSGNWYDKFDDVPVDRQGTLRPSLFPPDNVADLHLERCRRILPHDQNTGGFFLALLEKVAPLPWMKASSKRSTNHMAPSRSNQSAMGDCLQTVENDIEGGTANVPADPSPPLKRQKADGETSKSVPTSGKGRIFNEKGFAYLNPQTDSEWGLICAFYDMGTSLFDAGKLMYRGSESDDTRRRNLYYTNQIVKDIVQLNSAKAIKIVNTGVRLFSLMEDKQFSGYRFLQDGVDVLDAFLPKENCRRVHLTSNEYTDLVLLLEEEMPLIDRMTKQTQEQLSTFKPGPVLVEYQPGLSNSGKINSIGPQCRLVFAAWRGLKSLRHYIGRHERLHYMRIAGLEAKASIPPSFEQRMSTGGDNDDNGTGSGSRNGASTSPVEDAIDEHRPD